MRKNQWLLLLIATALGLLLPACAQIDPFQPEVFDPATDSGSADFSVLAGVGNSLTAGYTNGGLVYPHQVMGYSAQFAAQLGKEVVYSGGGAPRSQDYVLPGYDLPGTPGYLTLVSLDPPTLIPVPPPLDPTKLLNANYLAPYNDLGVPGADAGDFFTTTSGGAFDLVLRGQGTMYDLTVDLQPTFVLLWLGNNDVLQKVIQDTPFTPPAEFAVTYNAIVDSLLNLASQPQLVTANIFGVSSIPYATTVPPFVVNPSTGQPVTTPDGNLVPLLGPNGPLTLPSATGPGDLVMVTAIPLLEQGIGIPSQLGGTGQPLPKTVPVGGGMQTVLLFQDEVVALDAAVDAYNQAILDVASSRGIPVVNAYGLLEQASVEGIEIGGIEYTTEFITGGLIGLDGIHPTDLGYAVLANAFIEAVNGRYGSSIPLVDLRSFVSPTASNSPSSAPEAVGAGL